MSGRDERGSLPVVIRPVAPRDLPGLMQMARGGVRFDQPESILAGYSPLGGLLLGRWVPSRLRRWRVRTYVARCANSPCAFVQVRDRATPRQWHILHLGAVERGPAGSAGGRVDLWTALLDYVTVAAGRRGIHRLYARLPGSAASSGAAEAFRAAGYSRYGEEALYLLRGWRGDPAGDGDGGTRDATAGLVEATPPRPQAPGDTWAVHRLYTLTAPKPAQYAEAYTSHRWELAGQGWLRPRGGLREWGFLVERGHELAVYCRVGRQGNRSRLEFLFDPDDRDLLAPTLDAVLAWLAPGPHEQVYCAVQEFQQELGAALEARGFEPLGVQELLVRYTTVAVRAPAPHARPVLEKVRGGVPAHVSSWLGRPATPERSSQEDGHEAPAGARGSTLVARR